MTPEIEAFIIALIDAKWAKMESELEAIELDRKRWTSEALQKCVDQINLSQGETARYFVNVCGFALELARILLDYPEDQARKKLEDVQHAMYKPLLDKELNAITAEGARTGTARKLRDLLGEARHPRYDEPADRLES